MSELTNEEKIDIMSLASSIVCNDEAVQDQPKDKNILGLYHAMIKAITDPRTDQEKKTQVTGPTPMLVSKENAR